jgi:hypothetical protein
VARRPATATEVYACPMHPDVVRDAPGECPLCHMALSAGVPSLPDAPYRRSGDTAGIPVVAVARHVVAAASLVAPARAEANGSGRALVRADALQGVAARSPGRFSSTGSPDENLPVVLSATTGAPGESRVWVSFRFLPGLARPRGDAGWLTVDTQGHETLQVPTSAVSPSPDGPFVFVLGRDRRFLKRFVTTGATHGGGTSVVSGLSAGEAVASARSFFLEAASRQPPWQGDAQ